MARTATKIPIIFFLKSFNSIIDIVRLHDEFDHYIQEMTEVTHGMTLCFCHNDLHSKNIIVNDEPSSSSGNTTEEEIKVYFIDFEYASYNYRAFDIANHFCEYQGFQVDTTKYANEQQQKSFITHYLEVFDEKTGRWTIEGNEDSVESLFKEVEICAMLSDLYWGIWAIFQSKNSQIDFDYKLYAKKRLDSFKNRRRILVNKQVIQQSRAKI